MKLRKVNEKRKIVRKKKKENERKVERKKEKFRNIGSTNDCPLVSSAWSEKNIIHFYSRTIYH
jgi:hypothetical protein